MNDRAKSYRRFFLSVGLTIVAILVMTVTSFALWYRSVTVGGNTFQTGVVSININDGLPVITEEDFLFEPGATIVKEFFIENESTIEVYYRIYFENLDGALQNMQEITLLDGDDVIYNGTAAGLLKENAVISEDPLDIGEKVWLTAVFHLPEDGGNAAQEEAMCFDLCADAVQTRNNPDKLFE